MSRRAIAASIVAAIAAWPISSGCGAASSAPASPGEGCRDGMAWGGWDGSVECAAIARTLIPAVDLACESDRDCSLVGRSSCGANAVSATARPRYADHRPACGHPAAGACEPLEFVAVCRGGCCNVGVH